MIHTAGTENRSRRFIQFAYIKLSYIIAIFFPSLADSKRAFLAPPCRESIRRLSASASWESHPRALARTLSSQYHHSSRLSSPPSGAVPDGRTLVLRLADLSATEVLYRINWYEDEGHLICQRSVLRNQSHKSDCQIRHSATLVRPD